MWELMPPPVGCIALILGLCCDTWCFALTSGALLLVTSQGGKKNQTLTPVTVKILHDAVAQAAGADDLVVNGTPLSNVTLVGKVVTASAGAEAKQYTIDDGTGTIECQHWGDETELFEPKSYVRVYGTLKKKDMASHQFNVFSIKAVKDFNEVTYHSMEVIYVDTYNKKQAGQLGNMGGSDVKPVAAPAPAPAGGMGGGFGGGHSDCRAKLQAIFDSCSNQPGLTLEDCAQQLREYNQAQIRDTIDQMQNDGALYTTIDDSHWMSTTA